MSSLYKRKLKSGEFWYGQVRLRDGRWKAFNTKCQSKRQAMEVLKSVEVAIANGGKPFAKLQPAGRQRLDDVAKLYLERRSVEWSPRTRPLHESTLRLFMEVTGNIGITGVGREEVQAFTDNLVKSASVTSNATINIHLRNLAAFLRWAKRHFDLRAWAVPDVPKLKAPAPKHRDFYSPDEASRLVTAAMGIRVNGQPFGFYIAFLFLTGMRKRESLALDWAQVDRRTRLIFLAPEITKAHRADTVPLTAELEELLDLIGWKSSGRVFTYSADSGHVAACWNEAVVRAGIRRLKLHNCRDSFAVNHLLEGVPLAVVSRMLRHKSITTTMQDYAAFSMEDVEAILRRKKATQEAGEFTTNILRSVTRISETQSN